MRQLGQWQGFPVAAAPSWGVPVAPSTPITPVNQQPQSYYRPSPSPFTFRFSPILLVIYRQNPYQLQLMQRQQQIQQQYLQQQQQLLNTPSDTSTAAATVTSAAAAAAAAAAATPPLPTVSWTGLAEVVGALALGALVINYLGRKGGGGGAARIRSRSKPKHHIKKTTTVTDEEDDEDE